MTTLHHETDLLPCPGCGHGSYHPEAVESGGVGSWCTRCESYVDELAGIATKHPEQPSKPSEQPSKAREKPSKEPDPILIIWPWEILANVNDRVAPTTEHLRRKLRRYKNGRDAMAAIAAQVANGREPFRGPVRVTFDFYPPDERADPQNYEKAALDALEGPPDLPGVYLNDRQARHRVSIDHGVDTERPRMEVRVEAIHVDETEGT